ncbi:serine hydrolase domain-containing protein [Leeia sp.]|uniref:serine hydrolase domain-containing protein n=1 Tax=Leeia sp. TaxID=2884678 RepID=UPI0035B4059A
MVIRQLEANQLPLETPVQQLMPAFSLPDVTVDHLLRHVSGLTSYNEDPDYRQHPGAVRPELVLQRALQRGRQFCPGSGWYYSNTGYQQLSALLEHMSGESYAHYANAELQKVLGPSSLQVLQPDELPPDVAPLLSASGPVIQPGWPQGAGALVGSPDDMLKLWQAILQQRFWKHFPASRLFERMHPMFEPRLFYGRGVMRYEAPLGAGRVQTWLGHSGGTPGAQALVAWIPEQQVWIAVVLAGEGSAEATAALLARSLLQY